MDDPDKVFMALANPSRRTILDLLSEDNGQTLGALCGHLDMKRQSTTKHIDILIDANLVTTVSNGREKLHFINPIPIHEIYERWIPKFERRWLRFLHDLKVQLKKEDET